MTHAGESLFVLTGAPGAGKTTLLNAAAARGIRIGREAARAVIQVQTAIDGPALQWRDPARFAELMLDRDIQTFEALCAGKGPALCDRGIPDLLAYGRIMGLAETEHFARAARLYRYNSTVFLAPPWREIYADDAERTEGWEHAQRIYGPIRDAYAEIGYRVVELPKVSVEDRLTFVLDEIAHA
ncbi:putative ATPase [Devosia subaequoris]|uniref:Putative ATPase n=1 Tax=Devosia subaequoris TaxID=395930 RepID=A0A7W6IKL3_9HYPH|nr:AAA family ATPase [Devosia subaequoris]MBB4051375.1 putative ATPase [Devosia subaequoris]MCP1208969.1 AAA family ATPase [Devosia subaequoris]